VTRLNVVLLLVLLFSSVYLVRVSHESRRLFAELDKARNDEHLLDNEFERLKSDKQSQATPLRVEKTARAKLAMRSATPAVTQYVNDSRVSASSGAASVPRSTP
jgi:cell division protein FtsL